MSHTGFSPAVGFRTPTPAEKWAEVRRYGPRVRVTDKWGADVPAMVEPPGGGMSQRAAWRVLRRACRYESFAEATQYATSVLLGHIPVHVNHHAADPDEFMRDEFDLVSFSIGPVSEGRYAMTMVGADASIGWHAGRVHGSEGWTGQVDRTLRRHRMWLLTSALRDYRYSRGSTVEILASPKFPAKMTTVHAALLHWWDDRMTVGHTVESARTLLGLLARPETLALTEWSPEGHPLPRTR